MEGGIGRREALRRAMILLAGVFGVGLAKAPMAIGESGSAKTPYPARLLLFGEDWRLDSASAQAGAPLTSGERGTVYGTLTEGPGGQPVGEFQGASFFGESPLSALGASVELHTFKLGDDVIFGVGNSGDVSGVFAVIGGSGRFIGVRGSYVAEQSPFESGGDGTARFDFSLL